MASTRNKNTAENYASQQKRIEYTRNNVLKFLAFSILRCHC